MTLLDVSLILPVYNEVESLRPLHEKIVAAMDDTALTWEAIYVDDGSSDGSTDVLRELQQTDAHVVVAVQRHNIGKSAALMVGFALARGRSVITMDADLQDEPTEIPRLLAALESGYDLVVGWKEKRRDPLSKRIPSLIANTVTSQLSGLHLHDMNSGLKGFSRECAKRVRIYGQLHRYIPVLAYLDGFRVTEIAVVHHPRQYGQSKYGVGRLVYSGFDVLTVLFLKRYRYRPLHLFGPPGALMVVVGLVINVWLTVLWFVGERPIGNRPLLTLGVLLILTGVQLLSLGLIAEMIVTVKNENDDPLETVRHLYPPGDGHHD